MSSTAPAKLRLSLPIPAYRADGAAAVSGVAVLAWAERFDVIKASRMKKILLTTQIGQFADHAYPFADRSQRLLADCWCLWTLLVDEFLEERLETGLLNDTVSDLSDPFSALALVSVEPSTAAVDLCDALADLWDVTSSGATQAWQGEFLRNVAKFIMSCHREAQNRLARSEVTFAEYLFFSLSCVVAPSRPASFSTLPRNSRTSHCPRNRNSASCDSPCRIVQQTSAAGAMMCCPTGGSRETTS